jgi:starch synthase
MDQGMEALKVLFVAAEAAPFAKVGGLAEFSAALPKALHRMGVDVRVAIPRYGDRSHEDEPRLRKLGNSIRVPVGSSYESAHLLTAEVGDVPVYLIYNDQHFGNRDRVYGFNDDPQRFVFFSRAVLAALETLDWVPDVIHANDWHTAPIVAWLATYGRRERLYKKIATLFTIHNFAYQGTSGRLLLNYGRMMELGHLPVEPVGKVNWMAQGIGRADRVNTVSPTYAEEMLGSDITGDLQPLLEQRRDCFCGILSGIDTELWDPSQDAALAQTYELSSVSMRSVNKTALQRELRLPAEFDVPLLGLVTRLDPLKGLDLLLESLEDVLARHECQFVILGVGADELAEQLQALQGRHPQSFRAIIRFDERLARRLYASLDLFVLPSRHESVSVGLMTAMRYGAVPVVRAIGGLADVVVDADEQPEHGQGFTFTEYSAEGLTRTIGRALAAYGDEARWVELQRRAMERDSSWKTSAQAYLELYQEAKAVHQRA